MILPRETLRGIERTAHPIKSRLGLVPLERNERVTDLPDSVLADLRELVTGFVLRAYPEMDDVYDALSTWSGHGIDELLFTEGADGGLMRVFSTYVSPGDEVVTITPSYAMYPVYCQMHGAVSTTLGFDENLELSFETVCEAVRPGVRLLGLVNPNQPIECCFDLEQLRSLARRCADNDTLLLVDEAYFHFCRITAAPLTREFENVVVARTLSKAFGLAGLRIGYLMAAPPTIRALRALKPIYEINHLNAAIAAYFLRRPGLMEGYVADVDAGREVLTAFALAHGCSTHGRHSNTLLIGLRDDVHAEPVVAELRTQGWLIRAETKPPTANHLRITLGPASLMQDLCGRLQAAFLVAGNVA